jgi:hypothetical protein
MRDKNRSIQKSIPMHRFILRDFSSKDIDHVNGDGLDNQKHNLRPCERWQNAHNRGLGLNNTSGFKGVHFMKSTRRWRARIGINGRRISLGLYGTALEAANAYDEAARNLVGEFASLNFARPI